MIDVVAIITAYPGQRSKVLEAPGLPASMATLGADTFVVIEKWADLAALQAHAVAVAAAVAVAVAPHMKAYAAQVKALTAARVIHVLEPVAAG